MDPLRDMRTRPFMPKVPKLPKYPFDTMVPKVPPPLGGDTGTGTSGTGG